MELTKNIKISFEENSHQFMGIRGIENHFEFVVPATFHVDDDIAQTKKNLVLFLDSLKYSDTFHGEESEFNMNSNKKVWALSSYLWLIRDYLQNGFFYNREIYLCEDNRGKINWKKTLKTTPIVINGQLIYNHLITYRTHFVNDLIAEIYKYCLKLSLTRIGWAFDYTFNVQYKINVTEEEMVRTIKNEYNNTFDDTKKHRYQCMLDILDSCNPNELRDRSFEYGVNNYYHVYEKMVNQLLHGIDAKEMKKYYPSGKYYINGENAKASSNLFPDIIYRANNKQKETFIFDAKMYRYSLNKNINYLPSTDSIQKQITYGDFIYNNIEKRKTKVRNAFILPFNKNTFHLENETVITKNILYIGYASADWQELKRNEDYDHIYIFLVDFNYLLNSNSKLTDDITKICDHINTLIANKSNK